VLILQDSLVVSNLLSTFAMSNRREKAKAKGQELNKQLMREEKKPRERSEQLVELGKFFIDLAKLVFGGVILTVLMDFNPYKQILLEAGLLSLVVFVSFGYQLIRLANKK